MPCLSKHVCVKLADRHGIELLDRHGIEVPVGHGIELPDGYGVEHADGYGVELADGYGIKLSDGYCVELADGHSIELADRYGVNFALTQHILFSFDYAAAQCNALSQQRMPCGLVPPRRQCQVLQARTARRRQQLGRPQFSVR